MKLDQQKIESIEGLKSYFGKMRAYVETGKALELTVKPWRKRRTLKQNSALRYGEGIVAKELGCTIDEIHNELCCLHFGTLGEYRRPDGTTGRKPVRTTTINEGGEHDPISTRDCAVLFDFLQAWAASELQIHIPDPDPDYRKRVREQITNEETEQAA